MPQKKLIAFANCQQWLILPTNIDCTLFNQLKETLNDNK